ncbi:serine/threonine-protein kinase [Actinoplanes xinjiangensis]|nr:serine/threonine-protein kinase [Actinoplanes xinjiangensis]GIF43017.1 protein kinase [Actinoplanes xinjiangensis]
MGEIHRAYDTRLDRFVALKLINRDLLDDDVAEEFVRRFRREARLAARVTHPGIPMIHDVGRDGRREYIVAEWVEGSTIRELIDEVHPVPLPWVVFIATQVSAVLAHTHAASLIHRDLAPDNVILCPDGGVKVVDFGAAILYGGLSTRLTPPGLVIGRARYQAPERTLGISTPRTDLYALGHLIQDLLTGHEHIPDDLAIVAAELTSETPQHRPGSAAEVYDRLSARLEPLPRLVGFVNRSPAETILRYNELRRRPATAVPENAGTVGRPLSDSTPVDLRRVRSLAERYGRDGQHHRAVEVLEEAIAQTPGRDRPEHAELHRDLAMALVAAGDAARSAAACAVALDILQARLPEGHPAILHLRREQARAHADLGEGATAVSLYRRLVDEPCGRDGLPADDRYAIHEELAVQYAVLGDTARAVEVLDSLAGPASMPGDLAARVRLFPESTAGGR